MNKTHWLQIFNPYSVWWLKHDFLSKSDSLKNELFWSSKKVKNSILSFEVPFLMTQTVEELKNLKFLKTNLQKNLNSCSWTSCSKFHALRETSKFISKSWKCTLPTIPSAFLKAFQVINRKRFLHYRLVKR